MCSSTRRTSKKRKYIVSMFWKCVGNKKHNFGNTTLEKTWWWEWKASSINTRSYILCIVIIILIHYFLLTNIVHYNFLVLYSTINCEFLLCNSSYTYKLLYKHIVRLDIVQEIKNKNHLPSATTRSITTRIATLLIRQQKKTMIIKRCTNHHYIIIAYYHKAILAKAVALVLN